MRNTNYRKDSNRRKIEKTKTRKHVEREIAGEILAIDPQHKPRGGYKRLMRAVMDDYINDGNYSTIKQSQ